MPHASYSSASASAAERACAGSPRNASVAAISRAHVDDHLGWMALPDGDYLVRERSPGEDTLDASNLDSATRLGKLAEQWGSITAAAHARGDDDFRPDLVRRLARGRR